MATSHASDIAVLFLAVFRDTGCEPYAIGRMKNKVVGGAFRMAVDEIGKFTTERVGLQKPRKNLGRYFKMIEYRQGRNY